MRNPVELALALALGADAVAIALPFLEAAVRGGLDEVLTLLDHYTETLRILHFVCGARTPADLRGRFTDVRQGALASWR